MEDFALEKKTIAILALQGAFEEHKQMLDRLGVESLFIRNLHDWESLASTGLLGGVIIPGGESTAMTRIMNDEGLTEPLRKAILGGLPVFGTCAGMIMLDDCHLGVMDVTVKRNAYGRQLGSFHTEHECSGIGTIPMTFIRAPYIERVGEDVEVLSVLDGNVIAARKGNMLVCSFHPELDDDTRMHQYFLNLAGMNL